MQASHLIPLSITRHAIQLIWQAALIHDDLKISGLLASQLGKTIDEIAHKPLAQILQPSHTHTLANQKLMHELKLTAQTWSNEHTILAGVYQCEQPNTINMQATEKLLTGYFQLQQNMPFVHLYIRFDTDGVLQSEAWTLQEGLATQVPMLLIEDRQL